MTSREAFFECKFLSARGVRTTLVRAWDAREAERAFRAALREVAPGERGSIEVTRTAGSRPVGDLASSARAEGPVEAV